MSNQDVVKAMVIVTKGVLKVAGTVLLAGVALAKSYDARYNVVYNVSYNDAVEAIMSSSMWTDDKARSVSALKLNAKPEIYAAVIRIVKSTMWSNDKLKLIIELCNAEEA